MAFDPSTYVSKSVHGGVRELTEEEAKPIRERTRKRLKEREEKLKELRQDGTMSCEDLR